MYRLLIASSRLPKVDINLSMVYSYDGRFGSSADPQHVISSLAAFGDKGDA